jgi:hypothetical protein
VGVFRREEKPQVITGASIPQITGPSSLFLQPAAPVSYLTPRSLTAAAAQIKINDKGEFEQFRARRAAGSSGWQSEAWEYYDAIGEIKYAFNLVASVVSRIRIYAASVDHQSDAPTPVSNSDTTDPRLAAAAERAIERLNSAYGGQSGLLRDAALNLVVAGECYLVQIPGKPSQGIQESWDIRSIDEVMADSRGGFNVIGRREQAVSQGNSAANQNTSIKLGKNAFIGRIWRSHPRFSDEAESSLRGLLDLCAELLLLNRTFRATARSRLNAGALYLPDGLSVAAQGDGDFPYDADDELNPNFTVEEAEDEFEEQLMDAMTTPIRDEESASAVVPLIIRGPAELGDRIKQFKFERSFDPALAQRADRVLERILQGLDVPKDIVTGLANVKYSNALQIDESLYKAHIEPLMLLIADALTVVYLRPYLVAQGYPEADVKKMVVWYDPSAIATRNDRATDADSGFDRGAVSYSTWRRTHGFSEADAPSPNEIAIRMMYDKGAITPELTEAMLGAVAPEVMQSVRGAQQEASVAPIPPEVQEALGGQPAATPEQTTETPQQEDLPAEVQDALGGEQSGGEPNA